MANLPLVSIVIPVFNGAEYVSEAIDSVLAQDYSNIELFVLDDGSTDDTPEVLSKYSEICTCERHDNMGQAATLNKGWKQANGEILGYLSCDDILLPNAVSESIWHFSEHEDTVLTYCDYYLIDSQSEIIRRVYAPNFKYREMVVEGICAPGPGAFFRREPFEETGWWDSSLRQVPDFDYWIRLGLKGKFLRIPEPLAKFRVHGKSQSHEEPDERKAEEILHVMERYFQLSEVPRDIREAKGKTLSRANILAARFHLRAGRYGLMFKRLFAAWRLNILCFLSVQTFRFMADGMLYRLKKIGFIAV